MAAGDSRRLVTHPKAKFLAGFYTKSEENAKTNEASERASGKLQILFHRHRGIFDNHPFLKT